MQRIFPLHILRHPGRGLMVLLLLVMLSIAIPIVHVAANSLVAARPWMNAALTPDQRADQLIAQMTLDEKIAMLHGVAGPYVGYVPPNTRLGIPALNLEDGPAGVAEQFSATASTSGTITIQFSSVTDQAQINGIEIS